LRAEQIHKMHLAKAEAQKKADAARYEVVEKPKTKPKSKFGMFGQKFTDAVLFPQGGEKSTMF
jgi:hypothetical protein